MQESFSHTLLKLLVYYLPADFSLSSEEARILQFRIRLNLAVPEASVVIPSKVSVTVAVPEATVVIPSQVSVIVLVASEVVFASHPSAITVKPTLSSDCSENH